MKWIEQQEGTVSYLPWTWNTWGAEDNSTWATDNSTWAATRLGGGGEALVKVRFIEIIKLRIPLGPLGSLG